MGKVQRMTNSTTGGPVFVDVKDGKILRITPMDLDESDNPTWSIEARGRTFAPPRRTTVMPYTAGHKSMIYSPKRVLTPLKRVDFDPNGERNCEKRGESAYEPITWDEALDIVCNEIDRVKRTYGPGTILTTCGSHHLWGNVGYRHSAYLRFSNLVGMVQSAHNPDSWEGWHWGGMHMWGFSHRLGIPEQYDLLEDALKHTEMIVFWSADPESTGGGIYSAFESTVRRFWLKELGVKMIFIDPYYNHTAGLIADKWFSPRLGTDVALGLGIAYTWLTEGTYDKEYVAESHGGLRRMERLRPRQERRRAQDPRVGRGRVEDPGARHPRARAGVGRQEDHAGRRQPGRLGRRLPFRHRQRMGPHHDRACRHAGHGQTGQQHLGDLAGLPGRRVLPLPRLRRRRHLRRCGQVGRRVPLGIPYVRGQAGSHPLHARLHRGPDHLAPAYPGSASEREDGVQGQGVLRFLHREPATEVRVSGAGLSPHPHVLAVWRFLLRNHDSDQSLCEGLPEPEAGIRGESAHLVGRRGQVRRHRPAGLHQLRALGHQRVCQLLGLHPRCLHADQQPGHQPADEVHRAAGQSRSRTTTSSRLCASAWASVTCSPWAARTSTSGSKTTSMPPTCPS